MADIPAILGGPPASPQGPPPWPVADADILAALECTYADGSWGKYHGGTVERLENALASFHGVEFCVACASGTYAVELALRALKIGPGDEVLEAAYDYGGNFLNIHAVGAMPVLLDLDANNWNLAPASIEPAISPQTRGIIVSHLHGGVVPMRAVMEIAGRRGLAVIEDAAQMPGAMIEGRRAGTWGDVGILSFGGSKLLTAGRGGALVTRRADVHQRARVMGQRGNLVAPLSELQAAVLLPQLEKLDARNEQRSASVAALLQRFQSVPGLEPFVNSVSAIESRPGYYKLGFRYDEARFGLPRSRFIAAIQAEGIALDEGFKALHVGRSPSRFRALSSLAEASRAHAGALVLHHPVLLESEARIEEVAAGIRKIYANVERLRG